MDIIPITQPQAAPTPKPHVVRLDVLRACAILGVFLLHFYGATFATDNFAWHGLWRDLKSGPDSLFYLLYPLSYGWVGVPLFFVISGFVIHLSYLKSTRFDTGKFYLRRLWRIYPPYLLALIVVTVLELREIPKTQLGLQLATHLLLVHNFNPRTFYGIDPVFWSLATEFQLYLLYPLLLMLRKRFRMENALLITLGVSIAGRIIASFCVDWNRDLSSAVWECPLFLWFDWALGAWLAERFQQGKPALPLPRIAILACGGLLLVSPFFKPLTAIGFSIASVNAAILVDRYVRKQTALSRFEAFIVPLGVCSYSFYLLHHPIIPRCFNLGHRLHLPNGHLLQVLLYPIPVFAFAFLVSMAMYKTVEEWSMVQGRKVSK